MVNPIPAWRRPIVALILAGMAVFFWITSSAQPASLFGSISVLMFTAVCIWFVVRMNNGFRRHGNRER
jgi:uncharacterized membrane protein